MSVFNFIVQFIPGTKNTVADFLSRPFGKTETVVEEDDSAAGQFYKTKSGELEIYVPSWGCGGIFPQEMLLRKVSEAKECLVVSCFVSSSSNFNVHELIVITQAQEEDITLKLVREYIRNDVRPDKWSLNSFGERDAFSRYRKRFRFQEESDVLLVNIDGRDRIVIPSRLKTRYLKKCHETAHFGVKKTMELLDWAWWTKCYTTSKTSARPARCAFG